LVILEELLHAPAPTAETLLLAARIYLQTGAEVQAAQNIPTSRGTESTSCRFPHLNAITGACTAKRRYTHPSHGGCGAPLAMPAELQRRRAVRWKAPTITFANVGGMEELKEEIRMKILYPLTNQSFTKPMAQQAGGGILMYGPTGCGKTFLARATAGEVRANFISVGLHEILDMWWAIAKRICMRLSCWALKSPLLLFFRRGRCTGGQPYRFAPQRRTARHQSIPFRVDGVDTSNEGVLSCSDQCAWHRSGIPAPWRFRTRALRPAADAPPRAAILPLHLASKP
jgi:hypothetical protein